MEFVRGRLVVSDKGRLESLVRLGVITKLANCGNSMVNNKDLISLQMLPLLKIFAAVAEVC